MLSGRGVLRVSALLATLVWGAAYVEAAPASGNAAGSAGAGTSSAKKRARKSAGKKAGKKAGTKARKAKAAPQTKPTRAKPTRLAKQRSTTINEDISLTPFPSHPEAAKKALAQNRRDQLDDAERAARNPKQVDRWPTVLFHLRELDARADPEGCFWRLIAYYRLGQVDRARALRQSCDFVPKDAAIIEAEDEQAARLQPPTTVADKEATTPVPNPAPYTGAAPTHVER